MIRVVLTVLLAVALVAASLPALDATRTETTAERIGAEAERIERAAADLVAGSVAVDEPALAARGSLVVRAPSGFAAAPIDDLTLVNVDPDRDGEASVDRSNGAVIERDDGTVVGGGDEGGVTSADVALAYRFRGEPVRVIPIPNPTDTVGLSVVEGPITLRSTGESRIEFRFVTDEEKTSVLISRTG